MKKIILILLIVVSIFPSCFANYFDNSPRRFISYDSTERYKAYIDMDTVSVLRYDPPYYQIKADTYYFDYVQHAGIMKTMIFYYDYNHQTICSQWISIYSCDENGNLGKGGPINMDSLLAMKKYGPGYLAGEMAFIKAYNMPFTKNLFNNK